MYFHVGGIPASAVAYTPYTGNITALDANGNTLTSFTGTVAITASDPSVSLNPTSYNFTSANAGVANFQATFTQSGTFSVTATYGSYSGSKTGIVVRKALVFLAGANGTNGSVASLAKDGTSTSLNNQGGIGVAVDSGGNVWSIDADGSGLTGVSPAGTQTTSSPLPPAVTGPSALAIDGNSLIWVASNKGTVTAVSAANIGTAVFTAKGSTAAAPSAIVIDPSGDIWIANPTTNSVDKIIGRAAPVAPLSTAVKANTLGIRP